MTNVEKREERALNKAFKQKYGRKKKKERSNSFNSIRYYCWRKRVLTRDDKTCQYCGLKENLHAHHIKEWSSNPKLRYVTNNGLTLCVDCHDKTHDGLISYYEQQRFLREIVS